MCARGTTTCVAAQRSAHRHRAREVGHAHHWLNLFEEKTEKEVTKNHQRRSIMKQIHCPAGTVKGLKDSNVSGRNACNVGVSSERRQSQSLERGASVCRLAGSSRPTVTGYAAAAHFGVGACAARWGWWAVAAGPEATSRMRAAARERSQAWWW